MNIRNFNNLIDLFMTYYLIRFDDINQPMDDYVIPQMIHIKRALDFADKIKLSLTE